MLYNNTENLVGLHGLNVKYSEEIKAKIPKQFNITPDYDYFD